MSVQVYEVADTGGTTASGYFALNTVNIKGAILKHIFVDFGDTTSSFEFRLLDNKDRNIIYLNSCNTVVNRSYDIPLKGIYTAIVSNSTADANFKFRLATQDVY